MFIEQGRDDKVAFWEMSQKAFNEVKPFYDALKVGEPAKMTINGTNTITWSASPPY